MKNIRYPQALERCRRTEISETIKIVPVRGYRALYFKISWKRTVLYKSKEDCLHEKRMYQMQGGLSEEQDVELTGKGRTAVRG